MKTLAHNRSWFARLLCLWLAGSVLLGSSGFVVVEHWCLMSGEKIETRLMPKECLKACEEKVSCPQQGATSGIHKTPCCKEVTRFEQLKTEQTNSIHSVQFAPVVSDLSLPADVVRLLTLLLPANLTALVLPLVEDPLIHSGRSRLVSLCTWLI